MDVHQLVASRHLNRLQLWLRCPFKLKSSKRGSTVLVRSQLILVENDCDVTLSLSWVDPLLKLLDPLFFD